MSFSVVTWHTEDDANGNDDEEDDDDNEDDIGNERRWRQFSIHNAPSNAASHVVPLFATPLSW